MRLEFKIARVTVRFEMFYSRSDTGYSKFLLTVTRYDQIFIEDESDRMLERLLKILVQKTRVAWHVMIYVGNITRNA